MKFSCEGKNKISNGINYDDTAKIEFLQHEKECCDDPN
jgi:hypothetical protein